jgi:hypothetical protein
VLLRVTLALGGVLLLAACTSSQPSPPPTAPPSTPDATATRPANPTPSPVPAGPTRTAPAASCPLARTGFVHTTIGMRLGRITVLRSGGRVVGCRFYALQGSAYHASENLPGPRQPVVEITTQRYRSATDAHNAFVLLARAGRNPQQADLGRSVGACFQTDFYPPDHGQDFACAGNVGPVEVVVHTVDTTGTYNTVAITRTVLGHV